MHCIPIKTRIMQPPQDDLYAVLDTYLADVQESDIIAVSSKVVSIHEGSCIEKGQVDKNKLMAAQADLVIPRSYWHSPLTVTKHAFIGTSGIDESNADGHYILLPQDPFLSAQNIQAYLKEKHTVQNIGVIIVDSHSTPLRRGATGIAIGWCGFAPTISHVGKSDLFGRTFAIEVTNLVDGLAAGANVVMGETSECQPFVVMRDVPNCTFTESDTKESLLVSFKEDTFRVLYERFLG